MRNDAGRASEGCLAGMRAGLPFALVVGWCHLFWGSRPLSWVGRSRPDRVLGYHLLGYSAVRCGDGGGVFAAIAAALLLNARFLPMGVAVAPFLRGGLLRRALEGQTILTTSWALTIRDGGRFDRAFMIGATVPQYVAWTVGTVVGVLADDIVADAETLGLDVIFPAFFLALVMREFRSGEKRTIAATTIAAAVAAALVPIAPPGLPVLAA